MRDRKKSTGNSKRPKHEKPFYVVVFAAFLRVFFILYDAIVYIPFRIFANPEKKLELSKRVKVMSFILCTLIWFFRRETSWKAIRHPLGGMWTPSEKSFILKCFPVVTV